MSRLLGMLGATLGGAIGWWVGARVGVMTAFFASVVGTGFGLYAGWRIADELS